MITGAGALLAFGVVVVYVFSSGGRLGSAGGGFASAGLVLLAGGLIVRWPLTIPWAVLFAGGGYLLAREGNAAVDGWAAAIGVVLLLAAELASWSIEHDARIRTEPSLVQRRIATLGALVAGALFVNFVLLGAAGLAAPAGVLLAAVGVAASVAAVAVVLRLLRA